MIESLRMSPRTILLLSLVLSAVGCAVSPYQNRTLPDADGAPKKYFFAYGKFCGPGYPPLRQGQRLIDYWPPADDLDSICYAHDYCYASTFGDNEICDSALHWMVINYQDRFIGEGCWNLTTDLVIAFFGKNYGKSDTEAHTAASRVVRTTIGVPQAVAWAALKTPIRPFLKDPKEGTCNVNATTDSLSVIKAFEDSYKTSTLNEARKSLSVPIPQ